MRFSTLLSTTLFTLTVLISTANAGLATDSMMNGRLQFDNTGAVTNAQPDKSGIPIAMILCLPEYAPEQITYH
jgi:hypothetical protein